MTNTPAVYPTSVAVLTIKTNKVDVVNDDDCNRLQNEVVALQTYIGTNPHGSRTNLTTRLATLMATNGAVAQSNGFPASTYEGQLHWRPDQITLYIYGNGTWNSLGQSLSNTVISRWYGAEARTAGDGGQGFFAQQSLTTPTYLISGLGCGAAAFGTVDNFKFKKISGISSVDVWARVACESGTGAYRVSIGSANLTLVGGSTTPGWLNGSIDVSALNAGTTYDCVLDIRSTVNNNSAIFSLQGFGF